MYFVGAVFLFHFVQQIVHDAVLKGSLRRPAAALDRRFFAGGRNIALEQFESLLNKYPFVV